MANGNAEPEDRQLSPNEETKKPYIKPSYRFEQVFVTTALGCGKLDSSSFQCRSIQKS